MAVEDDKVMQDFELESLPLGADHSQKVKAAPNGSDYSSKDCVNLSSSTAVFRIIWNLPNVLSLLRLPLALLFLQPNPLGRCLAVLLAMVTDGLDGYLARRYGQCTTCGTWLDPLADKIFVLTGLLVLFQEQQLTIFEALAMLSRDYAIIVFVLYLCLTGNIGKYKIKPFWCGKISTCLQLGVFLSLLLGLSIPFPVYAIFIVLGLLALLELGTGKQ